MTGAEISERVRTMYGAFAAGDADAYRRAFAPDIVWHVPGENPVSGEYRGADEYFTTMPSRMAPLDEWRITPGDVLVNARSQSALVALHLVGSRRGVTIETTGYHFIRLDEQGRIVEGWGFTADQDGLDRFFEA